MNASIALTLALQAASPAPPAPVVVPEPAAPAVEAAPAGESDGVQSAPATSGEVVVTARRRAENVQAVPIALSVLGSGALSATGTTNVSRLTALQPALQLYATNPRNTAINIRGLGVPYGLTNDGIEQGVGIYIDQVYNGRIAAATFDFVDVDRVEVLRGPQGTLYGKNTTAGAVNIVTRAPSFSPEGRIELTGGNLRYFQAKASVSGPIVGDTVAARLSASLTTRRGTIYNLTSGDHVNSQDNLGIRGQVLIHATPHLDLTLYGDYNRQNPDCCAQIYVRTGATQRPLNRQYAALAAAQAYAPPSTDAFDRVTDLDSPLRAKQRLGGTSLVAAWDIGPATVTSISAYRFWDWKPSNDRDFLGLPITTVSQNPSQQKQYSQELRIASDGKNRLDYTLGLFLFRQEIDTQGLQVQGPAASRYLLNPTSANASNPGVLNGLTATNTIGFKNTSAAVFGKLNWAVSDRFHLQPGLRINYDRKTGSYASTVAIGGVALDCSATAQAASGVTRDRCGVLAPQTYDPRFSAWNVSGDLTASYDIAADIHGYAAYAKSFKSGGVNLSGLPLDANNIPILSAATVKPERVDHFEVGLKTQFDERRITVNLAGFWTEVGNYQATVTNGQLGVLRGYLANASKVRVRGIEFDTAYRASARLSLYWNGAITDARYTRFVDAPCPPELAGGTTATTANPASPAGTPGGFSPASCDISGQRLPGVSKLALSHGGEYNLPARLLGSDGQVYFGYDGTYRSRFSSNPSRSLYTEIGGYWLSNFRLGYRTGAGFNVFGWVRNAFDNDYYEVLALQSGNTGLVVGQPADPRTYGLTIAKTF